MAKGQQKNNKGKTSSTSRPVAERGPEGGPSRASNAATASAGGQMTSVCTGVSWFSDRQVWRSEVAKDGKTSFLGYFDLEEDAAKAHDEGALDHVRAQVELVKRGALPLAERCGAHKKLRGFLKPLRFNLPLSAANEKVYNSAVGVARASPPSATGKTGSRAGEGKEEVPYSPYSCVFWDPIRKKWVAQVRNGGELILKKRFEREDEDEAGMAVDAANIGVVKSLVKKISSSSSSAASKQLDRSELVLLLKRLKINFPKELARKDVKVLEKAHESVSVSTAPSSGRRRGTSPSSPSAAAGASTTGRPARNNASSASASTSSGLLRGAPSSKAPVTRRGASGKNNKK